MENYDCDRLRGANFNIRQDKWQFAINNVKILGHFMTTEGITPDLSKVRAMREYPQPMNVKEI